MIIFFIEESEKNKLFKKWENIEDRIILNCDINKINTKLMKKILKFLYTNNCNNVIISKKLKSVPNFINTLYANNINVVNGRKLFKHLLEKIIDRICIINEINPKNSQASITVNYLDNDILSLIENLSKKFKTLSIITNNIDDFKNIEKKIYEDFGILILVTNNKKQALRKTDIILNLDFTEELLNKYYINEKAILINYCELNKIRFCGKTINDYNIHLRPNTEIKKNLTNEKYKKYNLKDLAEIYTIQYPEEIENIIID